MCKRSITTLFFLLTVAFMSRGGQNDSVASSQSSTAWVKQLVANGFKINDPEIKYPRFPKFCVDVYNWGDRTFNSYDPDYVVGTGKNWKAILKNTNWMQAYVMHFDDNSDLHIRSDINSDLGVNLCFMAVSVSYTANANRWFHSVVNPRKSFNFNFCCALFSANLHYNSHEGGARITKFGDYNGGRHMSMDFDGVKSRSLSGDAYYFFNHRRYSQAAAYCYSKYQLKSAGSWIVGFGFSHQNIDLNFESLNPDMWQSLPSLMLKYDFHYADYSLLGGYGYNWVLKPRKWLVNATILPSIGYKHSYEGATDGSKSMFAANIRAMFSVVYNHKSLFAALEGNMQGHFYISDAYVFYNSNQVLTLNVGVRF